MSRFDAQGFRQKRIAATNVLATLAAEGDIHPIQMQTLATVCRRAGIDSAELADVLTDPQSVTLDPPRDDTERLRQLTDIVSLAMTGHELDEPGLNFCLTAAVALGFTPQESPSLLTLVLDQLWANEETASGRNVHRIPIEAARER